RRSSKAGTSVARRPSTQIVPDVGSMIRLIILSVVVFPHPDGPTSVTNSPLSTSSDRPPTAGRSAPGKVFVTSSRRIMLSTTPPSSRTRQYHATDEPLVGVDDWDGIGAEQRPEGHRRFDGLGLVDRYRLLPGVAHRGSRIQVQ